MALNKHNNLFNSLLILSMLFLASIILCNTFASKDMVYPFHGVGTPGMLMLPIAFLILDVITEIFGYCASIQVIWASIIAQVCFFCVGAILAYLPDPNTVPGAIPAADYHAIFGILPRVFIAAMIAMLIGMQINSKLLSIWQTLLKGKYFWLRSIGSSAIGDGIFIFLGTLLISLGRFPIHTIVRIAITAYLIDLTALFILSPVSSTLTYILKRKLKKKPHPGFKFNPFENKSEPLTNPSFKKTTLPK